LLEWRWILQSASSVAVASVGVPHTSAVVTKARAFVGELRAGNDALCVERVPFAAGVIHAELLGSEKRTRLSALATIRHIVIPIAHRVHEAARIMGKRAVFLITETAEVVPLALSIGRTDGDVGVVTRAQTAVKRAGECIGCWVVHNETKRIAGTVLSGEDTVVRAVQVAGLRS
jgi:hypothetical protein